MAFRLHRQEDRFARLGVAIDRWTVALESEYPDLEDRAVMLFRLLGSGVGRWRSYTAQTIGPALRIRG
jgi:hypothetical protein